MSASTRQIELEGPTRPLEALHPVDRYLSHLGPGSRRTMSEAIEKVARMVSENRESARELAWHSLRFADTSRVRDRLAASLAPATANKHLAALRGVLKQVHRMGLMGAEDYRRAIEVPAVQGVAPRPSRHLAPEERWALLTACRSDPGPAGRRDAAIFSLLAGAGLRRSQVVAIALADYDAEAGTLRLRSGKAKDGAAVLHTLGSESLNAIEDWIQCRGDAPGPLFNPVNKGGRLEIRRLSEQAIYVACRKRASEAGLSSVSPEDLRCTPPRNGSRRMRRAPRPQPKSAGFA